MPDKRTHRGPHPQDAKLFSPRQLNKLKSAVEDYSLLLSKGYAEKSSLKLVGDRFSLTKRQRLALMRCACSDYQLEIRNKKLVEISKLKDNAIVIDGYNLLITIESALSNALIFKAKDGCFRDIAGIHGTYRKVTETLPTIRIIADFLETQKISKCHWLLDSPVSNSGRLKNLIETFSKQNNFNWDIKLSISPDRELTQTDLPIVTTDSAVLDRCKIWVNLAAEITKQKIPAAKIIDLSHQ